MYNLTICFYLSHFFFVPFFLLFLPSGLSIFRIPFFLHSWLISYNCLLFYFYLLLYGFQWISLTYNSSPSNNIMSLQI